MQPSKKSGHLAFSSENVPIRVSGLPVPVFLSEGLLPHSHVLLLIHQSQQRRAGLNPQAVVVVLGVPPIGGDKKCVEDPPKPSSILDNSKSYSDCQSKSEFQPVRIENECHLNTHQ